MKIWRIDQPDLHDFPMVEAGHGWTLIDAFDNKPLTPPKGPLEIIWKRKLAKIGDFCWPILHLTPVARVDVAADLLSRFSGATAVDIQYVKDFGIRTNPPSTTLEGKSPLLKVIWTWHCIDVDEDRSTINREVDEDGRTSVWVSGTESIEENWNPKEKIWEDVRIRRLRDHGIYVPETAMKGHDIFRINQNRMSVYCTDSVRKFIVNRAYTGIDFLEAGDVI